MIRLIAAVLAAAVSLAPVAGSAADPAPLQLNVILPLTGPGALLGQTDQKALKVLEGITNKQGGVRGRPIQFTFLDDASNPQNTVQLSSQVLASKPNVVLGPAIAGLCSAAMPLFENAKTLMWCLSPTFYPPVGGFAYASLVGSKDFMRVMLRNMRARGFKRLAMLTTTDVTGRLGQSDMNEAIKSAENHGAVSLVADEVFTTTDVGVGAQISKIKAAVPDVVLIWTPGAPLGTALTAMRDAGMEDVPVFSGSASMIWGLLNQLVNVVPKNLYFVGFGYNSDQSRSKDGLRKLTQFREGVTAAGMHIDGITGLAWDGAAIVIDALRAVGPDATSEQLRSWVASQRNYSGISGLYNFQNDMHGLTVDDVQIVRWDPAKQDFTRVSKFGGGL